MRRVPSLRREDVARLAGVSASPSGRSLPTSHVPSQVSARAPHGLAAGRRVGPGDRIGPVHRGPYDPGPVGRGEPLRYRVEVEDSLDMSVEETAREINTILADPRGWTAAGHGFQLVASQKADMTIRVASPGTVDDL